MKKIKARTLLQYTVEQLWDILTGRFVLLFDDGELEVDWRSTIYSMYAWDFHRLYPKTPLLRSHHLLTVLDGKRLGSETHLELLGNVMWAVYDHHTSLPEPLRITRTAPTDVLYLERGLNSDWIEASEEQFRDRLAELIYRCTNKMYNQLIYRLEEYVVSLDIVDFVSVLRHPKIKAALDNAQPTKAGIDTVYQTISETVTNGVDLPTNPLSLAARSKLINLNQLVQCVGPLGFVSDTDNIEFRYPVMRGYGQGLRTLYSSMVESRKAATALLYSKTPLQQTEYFSRRLQLMSEIVQRLHPGDCGSTEYLRWHVNAPKRDGHKLVSGGDLKQLVGKNYVDENGVLRTVQYGDTHLQGKTLNLRSPVHCAHPDPYGICATCFGQLSLSVPENTNIGQMCCTSLAQKSSQSVLSLKHLVGSSVIEGIDLLPSDRQYLKVSNDENSYLLADALKSKHIWLVISPDSAASITDVMEVKDVTSLNITRVSEMDTIALRVQRNKDVVEEVLLEVHKGRRFSSMTYPLLHYIRAHGWTVDSRGNYVIDLQDWDWTQPILTLPLRHFSMSDHSKELANFLESSVEKMHERDQHVDPDAALVEWFGIVNAKLTVNLAVLEVVWYGSMIESAERHAYGLPKPWTSRATGVMKVSMANRSLGPTMAYEQHRDVITAPASYTMTNRPDHPMDAVVMPYEVLVQYGRGFQ